MYKNFERMNIAMAEKEKKRVPVFCFGGRGDNSPIQIRSHEDNAYNILNNSSYIIIVIIIIIIIIIIVYIIIIVMDFLRIRHRLKLYAFTIFNINKVEAIRVVFRKCHDEVFHRLFN